MLRFNEQDFTENNGYDFLLLPCIHRESKTLYGNKQIYRAETTVSDSVTQTWAQKKICLYVTRKYIPHTHTHTPKKKKKPNKKTLMRRGAGWKKTKTKNKNCAQSNTDKVTTTTSILSL